MYGRVKSSNVELLQCTAWKGIVAVVSSLVLQWYGKVRRCDVSQSIGKVQFCVVMFSNCIVFLCQVT